MSDLCWGEEACRPYGTLSLLEMPTQPAAAGWAKLFRPFGTGLVPNRNRATTTCVCAVAPTHICRQAQM